LHVVAVPHSFVSTHVAENPLPDAWKPLAHVHEYPPDAFVQTFVMLRSRPQREAVAHSFVSTHVSVCPLPCVMYPAAHEQV
jgi:hypothetical protein